MLKEINKKLLFLNLFALQSYLIRFSIFSYPSNLQEVLIALNLLVFLQATSFNKIIHNLKKHTLIWALTALSILSIITTDIISSIDLARNIKFIFFASILSYIFLETLESRKDRDQGIKVLGLGALAFGIFSLLFNLLGYNLTHDLRLNGPLDSAVYLAYYLAPFFIYFSCQIIDRKDSKHYKIYAAILALLILATQSMGAIGGCTFSVLLYLFLKKKKDILKSKTLKISMILVALAISSLIFYSKILPTITTNYSSLDERGEIWVTTIHQFKEAQNLFFGFGLGQFQSVYQEQAYEVLNHHPFDYNNQHPHNIFLLFLTQYGILGLFLITYLAVRCVKKLKSPSPTSMIVLYFFVHGLIDSPYFKNDITFLMIIFFVIGLNLYDKAETKSFKTL